MKNNILHATLTSLAAVILMIGQTGCKDMFSDPLTEKETGNKLTVLLMDRNFIKTKMDIRLQDASTLQAIDQEQVEIRFLGDDASHLITFSGELQTSFNTSSGFIEVGYDPNVPINAQNPLEITVIAISLNYISAPQFVSYTTEGFKNLNIKMVHRSFGKSSPTGAFNEPYDINFDGVLHSPKLSFIADITSSSTGLAWEYLNLYNTTSNGTILCNNLKDNIIYADYGIYYFGVLSGLSLVPPANPTKTVGLHTSDYVYSSVLRNGLVGCPTGLTIHVERPDGKSGTGVFDYRIAYSDGRSKVGQITCSFPSDNLIEQIYYPSANPAVSVTLTGDSQYDISGAVSLSSPCGATAGFTATPKSTLKPYKVITQYVCSDTYVGMALTLIGEFRKHGTNNPWTSFEFVEGVCQLLLEPDADYDFRANIDAQYYDYTIPTDPAKVEAFLIEHQGEDYTLTRLIVAPTANQVDIIVDVEFGQDWCNKIR